ncbi:MAG TPA: Ig-like domain-containing protein [Candidatus Sulfotelmatobacter sp.]|nr:Ig-like domain-containing protein [Candidatus Sulfotelmatobacter sp.]
MTAAYSGGGGFNSSTDNTHALTVSPAATTTTATNASASFNTSNQNVTLSATVTSGSGAVNTGTVTFTVMQGATTIGTPVTSGTVTAGAASATFVLPSNTAAATYNIVAVYSGTANLSSSNDHAHTLTVNTSSTTAAAVNVSATFSSSSQNVTLSATVTSASGTINSGTVTFTVSQGGTTIGTPVTSGTVASGATSATFSVPAGQAAGTYTITASYSGTTNLAASSDNTHTLTVGANATTTTAANASATFSTVGQNVTLSATITSPAGTVNTGTLTFTVSQGGTTVGTPVTSGTVTSGAASATYVLPGGTAVGTYKITAVYSGTTNLATSSDNTHTLTVGASATTTTAANASTTFSSSSQNVTLSATVTSGGGTVSAGTVTFTVSQGGTTIGSPVTSSTVSSGTASATFVLPGGTAVGTYTITAVYSGGGGFSGSSDATHTLTVSSQPLLIQTTSLPDGQQGVAYSASVTVTGGTPPYTWGVTGGAFPTGVTINTTNGAISGTPTVRGTFTVTIGVTDSSTPTHQNTSQSYTFTIVGPPVVSSASPATGNQGDTSDNILITGQSTHFGAGTTVSFGTSDITVNSVTVNSATSLTVNISISATAALGSRDITATTGSEVAPGSGKFTVLRGVPAVTLSPNFGVQGTNPTITITGSYTTFTQGLTTASFSSNSDIVAGVVTVNSPTQATVQLQITVGAALGPRTITVNTGSESAPGTFTVTQGAPAIVSVTPNVGGQNTAITVVVNANFTSWANLTTVMKVSGNDISVGSGTAGGFGPVTVNNAGQLTATLTISSTAVLGPRDITVKTNSEQEFSAGAFTVQNCTTTAALVLYYNPQPLNAATNVPLNARPRFEFNGPLDRTTISSANTYIIDSVTGLQVPSTVNVDPSGKIVTVTPGQLMAVGRLQYVYLGYNTVAKDACGNQLSAFNEFTTSFSPSALGPSVSRTSPVNNDSSVPTNTQVALQLDKPVDPLSVANGLVVSTGGTPVPGTWAPMFGSDFARIVFTPGTTLTAGVQYTVTYNSQLLDVAENPLVNPGSIVFTTGTATDTTAGTVTSTDPVFNETNVGTNIQPTFDLDKIIDPISVDSGDAFIQNGNTGKTIPSTVTVSADRMHVTITPNSPLQGGTQYYAYFGYGHQSFDLAGNAIGATYTYFLTGTGSDTTPPTVTQISPPTGATGTPVNTVVTAVVSDVLDPDSVNNTSITVTPHSGGTPFPGTVTLSADQQTLTWTPTGNTAPSTQYDVTVSGFRDTEENLVTPFPSTFTTSSNGTPVASTFGLSSFSPSPNGVTGQANNVPIVLNFTRVVDPTTVKNIRVYLNTGYNIAGTWTVDSVNGGMVTFNPAGFYPANATINWYTQCQVRDLAGNTDTCNSGSFTVGNFTDTTAPTVTVTPPDGTTGVGRNQAVVLSFSKSINPATVNGNNIQLFVGDTPVAFSLILSSDNRSVTLTGSLPPAANIAVVATPFVTDFSGNALVGFESHFTTAPDLTLTSPTVGVQRPANGATGVSPNVAITIFTNGKSLNPSTITSNSVLVSHNGVLINGTINIFGDGHAIEFVPSQNFNYGDIVQIFLSSAILDVDSNPFTVYTGTFTIAPDPASVGPNPVASNPNPEYNATNVPLNIIPQIRFDQALLASTVNSSTVSLLLNNSTPVAGIVSLLGTDTIQFAPSSPLATTQTYYLHLDTITNTAGKPLAQGTNTYYMYFTTGTATVATVPTVLTVSPSSGTTNVGINSLIFAKFSKPIDPITVSGASVQVTGGSQTAIPLTMSFNATFDTVWITPQAPFPATTPITIKINGVTDPQGNAVTPWTSTFNTGNGPDLDQPTVLHFSPPYGTLNVPTNTAITVQFSEPMNTATIFDNPLTTGTYLYDTVTGLHVPGTYLFSADLTTLTFVPNAPLLVGRAYYFYAYNTYDLEGNVGSDFEYFVTSFTTSATIPAVVNTNPESSVTGVPTNTLVQVQFNEPIKPESIALVQVLDGGTPVSMTPSLSADGLVVSLTPNALLTLNHTYTISVSGVQDYAGHTQSGPYTSTFTTGPTIDLVHGSVISTDPVSGETGVGTNVVPTFDLDKRVNPFTVDSGNASISDFSTGRRIPSTVTVSADRMSVKITPSAPLLPNTYYIAYFGQGNHNAYDIAGNYFNSTNIQFVTGTGSDTAGPAVTKISPPSGTTGAPVNTQVVAVVNDPVDPDTVTNSSITVTPSGSTIPVPGTVTLSSDQLTLTWVPSSNLAVSKLYNVSVGGFRDAEQNLATTFPSTFTTGTNGLPVGSGSLTFVSSSPAQGAVGQPNNVQINLTFSETLDPTTVPNIHVYLNNFSVPIGGTWVANGNQATFTVAGFYPANSTINWYTFCQVRDLAGNTDNCASGSFTTGATADTTAPVVTSVTPPNNATNLGPQTVITLNFSKSLNPNTMSNSNITLLVNNTPTNFGPTISNDARSAYFNFPLNPSTTYTIVATSDVTDLSGNHLTYFQSQFTTAPQISPTGPVVVTQRPASGATGVPPATVITLFTNGSPLDPATVTSNSLRISQNGVLIPGAVAVTGNNQAIEFTPSSNFSFGGVVQVYMDTTVTDVNGVPLPGVYTSSFTIGGDPATVGPNPVAVNPNPEYAAANVFTNVVPQIAFDQPLLPSTVNGTNVTLLLNNDPGTPVAGAVSLVNGNIVQFKPSAALTANSTYFLNFNGVTNTLGTPLGNGYYMYFTTGTASSSTIPTIVAVGPPDGATGIGINAAAVITFNSAIDPITVNASTVTITGGGQTVVPSTISFNTGTNAFTTATITPQAPLPLGKIMTFTISGVTDPEGHAVTTQTTQFTTGSGPVLTAPTVVLASSQSGDTIATNASYSYEFDRPMDPGTVNNQTFYLYDTAVGYMPGVGTVTLASDMKTETLVLPPGTLIAGHLVFAYSAGAQDLQGNVQTPFNTAYQTVGSTSDTTPPVVLETNPPASLTTGIPLNVSVQVEFSKQIAQNSVAGIQLLQGGSTLVPVTYSFSRLSQVVTLTPNVPLLQGTSYALSISGVTDTNGNVFSGTYTQTFMTGTAIKLALPQLLSFSPCCGQTAPSSQPAIQIVFDSPMNPLTFDTATGNAVLELTSTSAIVSTGVNISADFKTVTLTPSGPLTSGASYTILVKYGGVSDMAGNILYSSASTTFIAP